jgi:hypothetical protein
LSMMNCPTRRRAMAYPVSPYNGPPGHSGGYFTPYGADPTRTTARGDYAACSGDQIYSWIINGPDTLQQGANWTRTNAWPTMEVKLAPGQYWYPDSTPATGICYLRSRVALADITDGTTSTYLVGEKYLGPDWYFNGLDGADNDTMFIGYDNDNHRTTHYESRLGPTHNPLQDTPGIADTYAARFGSAHSAGCYMGICDGSVQMIGYSIDYETHRRLGNRKDGMTIDPKKF